MLRRMALLWTVTAVAGCGTIASTKIEYGPRIYGGVRYDVDDLAIEGFPLGTLCGLLDFPFSFTADTVMLPVTLILALGDSGSVTIVEGFVIEAGNPDAPELEVAISGPLPDHLKPIAGAEVRVGSITSKTGAAGSFSLRHQADDRWETLRIECPGYRPVEIPVSELHRLDHRRYWEDHSLRVRLQRK